jgi:hypothetical protein
MSNEGLSGVREAVLPPDRLNSPGWDKCEFISRDAFKQGSKARCVFQRELLQLNQTVPWDTHCVDSKTYTHSIQNHSPLSLEYAFCPLQNCRL